MNGHQYIACDLGAESGRVIVGTLTGDRLVLDEVHRFQNVPLKVNGTLLWDIQRLFDDIKLGLRTAANRGFHPESISCDSWGVDYVLLKADSILVPPYHYRDSRTDGGTDRTATVMSPQHVYAETGIQALSINTLVQLQDDLENRRHLLESADRFLHIGDTFNFLLSGISKQEESLASTSQLYSPARREWSRLLMKQFGFPPKIFPEVVPSGTVLGPLKQSIVQETGVTDLHVIAGCSHDTAAAVAGVPSTGKKWAYLSSGTWSLFGVESTRPYLDEKSMTYGFTNEIGFGGSIRFLKNIPGMWIIQECRRSWSEAGIRYSYAQLMELAEKEPTAASRIDPSDPLFAHSDNMPDKIAEACRRSGQHAPEGAGAITRCVLESLAHTYAETLQHLEAVTGRDVTTIHIVGGGSQNRFLNQLTANVTGRTVVAGPVECSAAGNMLVQAIALGHIDSIETARDIVHHSFPVETFEPRNEQRIRNDSQLPPIPYHA